MAQVFLIHGNDAEAVSAERWHLQQRLLPGGEDDGEIIDIRPPGNQPLKLERAGTEIIQELGTVSLLPDARRIVIVYQLHDFRAERKGSARAAKKAKKSAAKRDHVGELRSYLTKVLPGSENALVFVFEEDDEKGRSVSKTSELYELVSQLGEVKEFSEKRVDWQLDDALLNGNLVEAITIIRDWTARGGNAPFRLVSTLNNFLQLLLQARLQHEAREAGAPANGLFPSDLRPSLNSVPGFKAKRIHSVAGSVPLPRIRTALERLNNAQKSFFPTGTELVVHDPVEQIETLLIDLIRAPGR